MRLRYHTGPTIVEFIANQMRAAGLDVSCVGTEHVYVDVTPPDDDQFVRDTLYHEYGTTFGIVNVGL